jgi:hypothetical protein
MNFTGKNVMKSASLKVGKKGSEEEWVEYLEYLESLIAKATQRRYIIDCSEHA